MCRTSLYCCIVLVMVTIMVICLLGIRFSKFSSAMQPSNLILVGLNVTLQANCMAGCLLRSFLLFNWLAASHEYVRSYVVVHLYI